MNSQPKSVKDLKKFAHVMAIAFFVIGFLLFLKHHEIAKIFFVLVLIFEGCGLIYPEALRPVEAAWMKLAHMLGWFNTRVLLSILFYVILTPLRFMIWVMRKDLLAQKLERHSLSYWQPRAEDKFKPERYERLY